MYNEQSYNKVMSRLPELLTQWTDGIPSQHFRDERLHIRKAISVTDSGQSIRSNDSVNLKLRSLLYIRVQRHGQKERRSCRNSLAGSRSDHDMGHYLSRDTPCRLRLPTISITKEE